MTRNLDEERRKYNEAFAAAGKSFPGPGKPLFPVASHFFAAGFEIGLDLMLARMKVVTERRPPFPGTWVRREDLPGGLDAAASLEHICYCREDEWHRGITSEQPVQFFVRVD